MIKKKSTSVLLSSLILCLTQLTPVSAVLPSESIIDFFSENGIYYYNPSGNICDSAIIASTLSSSGFTRLKDAVKAYGEFAMTAQRQWGTPWEVVLAQMQKESSVGTAGIAVSGATNNWLGITGSGDAGSWTSSSGRDWAVYTSVEASITDWAGPRVLRSSYYTNAFASLNPTNYNLEQFLTAMISRYAPSSDGNNETAYIADVMSFINGPIREAREEMGWPSSAELAASENIAIGGEHPIGSDLPSQPSRTVQSPDCINTGSGDINQTAISLSWPDRSHANDDPRPTYYRALNETGGVATKREGDHCSIGGNSCDAFVATVMRSSGVDPNFPCCTALRQLIYLSTNPNLYEEIPNTGRSTDLQPGDIRAKLSHIEIYVVLSDGTGRIASASHCDRTADHAIPFYPDSSYRIFRKK